MGVTCSLLGHDYGEPEVVRSREEQANEVVETVREVKTCTRCGNKQTVSENTEVRAVREPEDVGLDEHATRAGDRADPDAGEDTDAVTEPAETDTATADPADAADDAAETDATDGFADDDFTPADSAEEDDGIILEDTADEGEDGQEQWSSPAGAGTADPTEVAAGGESDAEHGWPEAGGVDEGYDASNPADDADDDDAGVSFGGGLTPSRTEETANAVEDEDAELLGSNAGSSADTTTDQETATDAPDQETPPGGRRNRDDDSLVCRECGHQAAPDRLSLRAGDICPDCHRGYLEPRQRPR